MKKIKKILIAGSSTFTVKNLGDESMLLNLIQGIKNYDKKIKIVLLARHPSKKIEQLYGIKTIKNFEFDKRSDSLGNFFYGFNSTERSKHFDEIRKNLISADMVILAGNLFMELFPNSFMKGVASYTALMGVLSKFFNKKLYLASVNITETVEQPIVKEYLNFLSKNAEKVFVREKSAQKKLLATTFNPKKISVEGDPAFGIDINFEKKIIRKFIKDKNIISKKNKLISVCIRVEYWKNNFSTKVSNKLFMKYARILSKLSRRTGATLLFVPNGFYNARKWMDDRVVHKKIINYLDKKTKYISINRELNLFETVNLHSLSDFHITNRRHSIVFAVIKNIPTAIINTNLKGHLEPLAKDIGLIKNLINFNLSEKNIFDKIFNSWKNRKNTKKIMLPKVSLLRRSAKAQFKKLIK